MTTPDSTAERQRQHWLVQAVVVVVLWAALMLLGLLTSSVPIGALSTLLALVALAVIAGRALRSRRATR